MTTRKRGWIRLCILHFKILRFEILHFEKSCATAAPLIGLCGYTGRANEKKRNMSKKRQGRGTSQTTRTSSIWLICLRRQRNERTQTGQRHQYVPSLSCNNHSLLILLRSLIQILRDVEERWQRSGFPVRSFTCCQKSHMLNPTVSIMSLSFIDALLIQGLVGTELRLLGADSRVSKDSKISKVSDLKMSSLHGDAAPKPTFPDPVYPESSVSQSGRQIGWS